MSDADANNDGSARVTTRQRQTGLRAAHRTITVPDEVPQRLWLVAQYCRITGAIGGVVAVMATIVAFISPLPALQPVRDRPWLVVLAVCGAVSTNVIGERLLRRERLAAIVAFALLVAPLIAAAAGRSTRPWTLMVSVASAVALASVWRSLQ